MFDSVKLLSTHPAYKRESFARSVGTGRAANAVYIVIWVARYVEIDDDLNVFYINSPRKHIRCNEDGHASIFEREQGVFPLLLFEVGVDFCAFESFVFEVAVEVFDRSFSARKNEDAAVWRFQAEQMLDQFVLSFVLYKENALGNAGCRFANGDANFQWVTEQTLRKLPYLIGHGSREKEGLAGAGYLIDNGHDVLHKAHVEHPIGLVEHEVAHGVEVDVPQLQVGKEAARCCHHHVHAFFQCPHFHFHAVPVPATVNGDGTYIGEIGETLQLLVNLDGEFTGRLQYYGINSVNWVFDEAVEDG